MWAVPTSDARLHGLQLPREHGMVAFLKPAKGSAKLARAKKAKEKAQDERREKARVRRRDRVCRFPMCSCANHGFVLEASHDVHKGMGSKDGVSLSSMMGLICNWRHRLGKVSRDRGTLRVVHLTPAGWDGPVAWEVDGATVARSTNIGLPSGWFPLAREARPGHLEPLTELQRAVLWTLSEMRL